MKKLSYLSLFFILLLTNLATAELISFNPGESASYTITQKLHSFQKKKTITSNSVVTFDIKILDKTPLTHGDRGIELPSYDVEVTIKKLAYSQMVAEKKTGIVKYIHQFDSEHPTELDAWAQGIIGKPFIFKIKDTFKVVPANLETEHLVKFGGLNYPNFEHVLRLMFQMGEIDLDLDHPSGVEGSNTNVDYTLVASDAEKMSASFVEKMKRKDAKKDSEKLDIKGTVTWQKDHPLLQERTLKVSSRIKWRDHEKDKIKIEQSWTSTPFVVE